MASSDTSLIETMADIEPLDDPRASAEEVITALRGVQGEIDIISSLITDEKVVVESLFGKMREITGALRRIPVDTSALDTGPDELEDACLDADCRLIVSTSEGEIKVLDLSAEESRELLVTVIEDVVPKLKGILDGTYELEPIIEEPPREPPEAKPALEPSEIEEPELAPGDLEKTEVEEPKVEKPVEEEAKEEEPAAEQELQAEEELQEPQEELVAEKQIPEEPTPTPEPKLVEPVVSSFPQMVTAPVEPLPEVPLRVEEPPTMRGSREIERLRRRVRRDRDRTRRQMEKLRKLREAKILETRYTTSTPSEAERVEGPLGTLKGIISRVMKRR
jgi:predicted RNA-binding protein